MALPKPLSIILIILLVIVLLIITVLLIFFFAGRKSLKSEEKNDARYAEQIKNGNYVLTKCEMKRDIRYKQEVILHESQQERIDAINALIAECDKQIAAHNIDEKAVLAAYLIDHITEFDYSSLGEFMYCEPDLSYQNEKGITPLMAAAIADKPILAERLLKEGSPLEATDNEGKTALTHACNTGSLELVKMLLKNGANVTHTAHSGKKMIEEVSSTDDQISIIALLVEYGADTDKN